MSSAALLNWNTNAAEALSQLEEAHRAVGGPRAGRRTNTLQLNYAFVLLLSAHFQAYCRGLHSEATEWLVDNVEPSIGAVLAVNLTLHRQLDSRNAQPASLAADFNRLDFPFWSFVESSDIRNKARREKLERLNEWRNAVAHHDIDSRRSSLTPHEVTLEACRSWRAALNGLARSFDIVTANVSRSWCTHVPGDILNPIMTQTPASFDSWFKVGKRVGVRTSGGQFPAVLLEDRGAIASGRTKHVVRVAIYPDDPEQRLEFEISEDRILLDAA
jgi:hypothetical protein